jgi:CRP-like cAMP-binding protein
VALSEGIDVPEPEAKGYLGLRDTFDWAQLLEFMTPVSFEAGQTVLRHDSDDRSLYIVTFGTLEVLLPHENGTLESVAVVGPGGLLGEIAFLDGGPSTATVRARSDGEMQRLAFRDLRALMKGAPELCQAVLLELAKTLAVRLRRTDMRIADSTEIGADRVREPVAGEPGVIEKSAGA